MPGPARGAMARGPNEGPHTGRRAYSTAGHGLQPLLYP